MNCEKCGNKLGENTKFCVICGNERKTEVNKIQKEDIIIHTEAGLKDGRLGCPNCGAPDIKYSEKRGKLYCSYCNSTFDGKTLDGVLNDLSNLEGNRIGSGARNIKADAKDIITLACGSCGAEIVIDTKTSTQARCHWCRSVLSINSRIENGAVPDAILPFKIQKDEAKKEIEKFVGKRQFYALPAFKKEFTTENIMGVYFPYMLIDAKAHGNFYGQGEHQTRRYTSNKRTYYDAKLYHVGRDFDITIDNLTVESNKDRLDKTKESKTNNIINSIMPFDVENCIKFQSNYLVGYTSEKRDINIDELKPKVDKQLNDVVRHAINKDLNYYDRGIKWSHESVDLIGTQWIAAYLPVWLYSYYENKNGKQVLHYVAVNARTKETMGSVPINKAKLFLISAIIELFSVFIGLSIFLNSEGDEAPIVILIFLFMSGFIYHKVMTSKYRNKKARHTYEKETKTMMTNIKREDHYIQDRKRLSSRRMVGANNTRLDGDNVHISKGIVEETADKFIK